MTISSSWKNRSFNSHMVRHDGVLCLWLMLTCSHPLPLLAMTFHTSPRIFNENAPLCLSPISPISGTRYWSKWVRSFKIPLPLMLRPCRTHHKYRFHCLCGLMHFGPNRGVMFLACIVGTLSNQLSFYPCLFLPHFQPTHTNGGGVYNFLG